MNNFYKEAVVEGLFDANWYQKYYGLSFQSEDEAFADYVRKSSFSQVNPSLHFDSLSYLQNYHDVYESGMSPLVHYLQFGKSEGRKKFPSRPVWKGSNNFTEPVISPNKSVRIAVVLHIFYEDFIARFNDAISGVNFNFDVYISTTDKSLVEKINNAFSANSNVGKVFVKVVPNIGRNFGPLLVEFSKELLNYDLFLHMHSKKSLYSGREQVQWSEYLIEFLVRDKQILQRGLNLMLSTERFGLYYPTAFWNLPKWVNHWLKNKGQGDIFLKSLIGVEEGRDFFSYPVGGMFWAKSKALAPILNKDWSYEDFPVEPLPADGSILHVIERSLPLIARSNGYDQFHYDPDSGSFTADETHIFKYYYNGSREELVNYSNQFKIISLDVFDTLIARDFFEPDLAKMLLPSAAGLSISPQEFVSIRNNAELDLRLTSNFEGDVDIYEIYKEVVKRIKTTMTSTELADLEFDLDYQMIKPKPVMMDFVNRWALDGKEFFIVTDTYYSEDQIKAILLKCGFHYPYQLFVSSALKLRKDTGAMWDFIHKILSDSGLVGDFLHIGDNVKSDCQNSGDRGLKNFHILSPLDKMQALSFPGMKENLRNSDVGKIKSWGKLISEIGLNPFV